MKIKCINCDYIYFINENKCIKCGSTGGFLQSPSAKQIGNINFHLEDTLIHRPSGNEYQIKEIQANGFISICVKTILPFTSGKRIYISNDNILEYEVKK